MSVAEKRQVFESLINRTSSNSAENGSSNKLRPISSPKSGDFNKMEASTAVNPPPKPKRTFAHDIYLASKTKCQSLSSADQNKIVPHLPRPMPDPGGGERGKSIKDQSCDQNKTTGPIDAPKIQISSSTPQRNPRQIDTPKRPKYFQLSHEYEQIFENSSPCLHGVRRSKSFEELYATPSKTAPFQPSVDNAKNGQEGTPAHYCYAHVPTTAPPHIRWRKEEAKKHFEKRKRPVHLPPKPPTAKDQQKIVEKESPSSNSDPSFDSETQKRPRDDPDNESTSSAEAEQRASRARLVRRQTLIHYDQQETAFKCRKSPQLFELAALIELLPNDRTMNPLFDGKFLPHIRFKFPAAVEKRTGPDPLLTSLPYLCYPDVNRAAPKRPSELHDEHFVLIITDQAGDRKFAYCCRFVPVVSASSFRSSACLRRVLHCSGEISCDVNDNTVLPSLPQVFCVVTPVHAAQFYADYVREAVSRIKSSPNLDGLRNFLIASFAQTLPQPGARLKIEFLDGRSCAKQVILANRALSLRCNGLKFLLERLNVDHTLVLFASLLSERRVLIVGSSVSAVSKVVQAATAMLLPFEWPHTLIPVVPDSYVQLCFSPTPYLIGVLRSNLHELKHLIVGGASDEDDEEYILVYDLDYGIVKERDYGGKSIAQLASTDKSFRFLPTRIARNLKQNLKSAFGGNVAGDRSSNASIVVASEAKIAEAFLLTFVQLIGHYRDFIVTQQDGKPAFLKEHFLRSAPGRSHRVFLKWFVETGMFQIWMRKRLEKGSVLGLDGENGDLLDQKIRDLRSKNSQNHSYGANSAPNDFIASVAKRCASFLKVKR